MPFYQVLVGQGKICAQYTAKYIELMLVLMRFGSAKFCLNIKSNFLRCYVFFK
ncbi:hypothetical protein RNAN_2795 [Rheinheimera nanhaiensis E407-8]|uniref:Uncharacterized protein n=1 Tax=Rheinheimera nanhaiensis E407-8 TaxID=562729 RepID=I1E0F5_9GAMM|nr:hypothetical protein RNAN_2795 [Rheinheimera nanhaiensis E407-8]